MTDVDSVCREPIEDNGNSQSALELVPSSLFNSLNLNDIYGDIEEVIENDSNMKKSSKNDTSVVNSPQNMIYSGRQVVHRGVYSPAMDAGAAAAGGQQRGGEPTVKILIQPAQKAHRFRYECEGRLAGCILGANSTPENKTYPTIQVSNYSGKAVVVVSCVTRDVPHRPHPHKLVGKEGCKRGICTVKFSNEQMVCSFSNLGIQCVKRKDIDDALKEREDHLVDPFRTGFAHRHQAGSIDLNCVRLCFQVFLEEERDKFTKALPPVASEPIYDKKAMFDLVICKLSACSASVLGGTEIILLCEKIVRDDVQVRFYELRDGQITWEDLGDFQPTDVHKQVAISLKTPRYQDVEVQQPVDVYIQLRRPSDGATSEARQFQLLPAETDYEMLRRKRTKLGHTAIDYYLNQNLKPPNMVPNISPVMRPPTHMQQQQMAEETQAQRHIRQVRPRIKQEPPDSSGMASPHYPTQPSPRGLVNLQSDYLGHPNHYQPAFSVYYPGAPAQFPSPMDTSPHPGAVGGMSSSGGSGGASMYNLVSPRQSHHMHHPGMVPSTSSGGGGVIGLHHDPIRDLAAMSVASPEVITIPSYSSAGSNQSVPMLPSDHHSGESAHLSLGLGSLDSFSLSGMSLSQIGSHLSDTFLCLNSDSIAGELGGGLPQDYSSAMAGGNPSGGLGTGGAAASVSNRDGNPNAAAMYNQERSREQSLDSFSRIQNLQDEIKVLNQLGGGDIG